MATCPKCRKHFRVMEDELPESHGCPFCGYGTEPELPCAKKCSECGKTAWEIEPHIEDEDDIMSEDIEGDTYCEDCARKHGTWTCESCNGEREVQASWHSAVALEPRMVRCSACDGTGIRGGDQG